MDKKLVQDEGRIFLGNFVLFPGQTERVWAILSTSMVSDPDHGHRKLGSMPPCLASYLDQWCYDNISCHA
jgi:hypothetical protein